MDLPIKKHSHRRFEKTALGRMEGRLYLLSPADGITELLWLEMGLLTVNQSPFSSSNFFLCQF